MKKPVSKKQPKKSQYDLFKEAAKAAECDESKELFEEKLGKVIKAKDTRHQPRK